MAEFDVSAVTRTHPDYDAFLPLWQKCRDVMAGQEAVHAKGSLYLPRLSGQSEEDYRSYKARALFYNATGRTLDSLMGLVFRKPPVQDVPKSLAPLLSDVDLAGLDLQGFTECLVSEVLTVGRAGVLVDHPPIRSDVKTASQALAAHQRPFLRLFEAENVFDWRVGRVGNQNRLTEVRLREVIEDPRRGDGLETRSVEQIRVLDLDAEGIYRQRLFREIDGEWTQIGDPIVPLLNGRPLPLVPFFFFGPKDTSANPSRPPLLDLANVNLSHYRTSADLEHGAHFTGLPTAVITGHRLDEGESLSIGSGEAWVLASPDARVSFLEFSGQGLGALERLLARKEAQMAAIGARMLAPEKRAAETAETLAIRHGGEQAVLASLALAISLGLTKALEVLREWAGAMGEVRYELNRDYLPNHMSAQALAAHVQAWQAGALSERSLFEALQAGEVISPRLSFDSEQARKVEEAQNEKRRSSKPQ